MKIAKIILGVVAGALLITGGALAVETDIAVNNATSTFTKSTFDYIIDSPSNDQISQFKANTEAVSALFPVYNYEVEMKAASKYTLNFLVTEDMTDYDITFFNPKRIEKGAYDEGGLMLDTTAAEKIGAKLGDEVSFTFNITSFKLKVTAIYSAVSYQTMKNGIAMAKFTPAMAAAFSTPAPCYQLAFIAAADKAKCTTMLNNYIPMGKLMSAEEYANLAKASGSYTDEQITEMYSKYVDGFMKAKYLNSVQDKATYMAGAEDTVSSRKENTVGLSVLFAIIVPLVLAGGLVGFDFLGKAKDEAEKANGRSRPSFLKNKLIFNGVSVGGATVIAFLGVLIYSLIRNSLNFGTIILYSLPALAAFLIALPFVILYTKKLYGEAAPVEGELVQDENAEALPTAQEEPKPEANEEPKEK